METSEKKICERDIDTQPTSKKKVKEKRSGPKNDEGGTMDEWLDCFH